MARHAVASPFQHTQYATYLVAIFAVCCIFYDSTQGFIQRYHLNRKWFSFYGGTCLAAYLYVRPLIRRRLGSASHGYINWSTVYIVWLCCAVFYHLPSLERLGVDVRADLSILLAAFLLTLCVLAAVYGAHELAVGVKLTDPRLHAPAARPREVWASVFLNSMSVAVACSSYYSFCGNAADGGGAAAAAGTADGLRGMVCRRLLHPVTSSSHAAFSGWVLYGEPANSSASASASAAAADSGTARPSAAPAISPVFTLWLTLMAMFAMNAVADYWAAATVRSALAAQLRRESSRRPSRSLRRRSADYASGRSSYGSFGSFGSLAASQSLASLAGAGMGAIMRTVSSVGQLWSPTRRGRASAMFRDDWALGLASGLSKGGARRRSSAGAPPDSVGMPVPEDAPAPPFLPMFPWYSGTSADLVKTTFDLAVSVKVFLGRFDMRTMQVATASGRGGGGPPRDGDGFTYEHLAGREEAWFDFVADTGDGGDSTYSVARCLAAPQLRVTVPKEMLRAAGDAAAEGEGGVAMVLPRGDMLLHGGDLAYPNPTDETYEQRLFGPYEGALPPPAHAHPGHLVVNKPDLLPAQLEAGGHHNPPLNGGTAPPPAAPCDYAPVPGCACGGGGHLGLQQRQPCRPCRAAAALRRYDGPSAFAIPGNHDWIDGLETFTRHVPHRGWLGGWLLPQEKSYWALRLPAGWWVLGLDLALVDDLDMAQYSYFARLAEERMAPGDSVVLITHAPRWLIDWFWGNASNKGANLRQLVRGPLAGRVRLHLSGDLHFYMRHSFAAYPPGGGEGGQGGREDSLAGGSPSISASEMSTPAGGSPAGGSPSGSRSPRMGGVLGAGRVSPGQLHASLLRHLSPAGASPAATPGGGRRQRPPKGPSGGSPAPGPAPRPIPRTASAVGGSSEASAFTVHTPDNSVSGGIVSAFAVAASQPIPIAPSAGRPLSAAAALAEAGPGPAGGGGVGAFGASPPEGPVLSGGIGSGVLAGASPPPAAVGSWDRLQRWATLRVRTTTSAGDDSDAGSAQQAQQQQQQTGPNSAANGVGGAAPVAAAGEGQQQGLPPGWALNDPEHLVVCGGGGAFLHPTHVFSYSRFRPTVDPAAGPMLVRQPGYGPPVPDTSFAGFNGFSGGGLPRSLPSTSSFNSLSAAGGDGEEGLPPDESSATAAAAAAAARGGRPGEYRCAAAFPSPAASVRLGRLNLGNFRNMNSRFDIIGGALYFLLVLSVLPRCSGVSAILDATSLWEAARLFAVAGWETVIEILSESRLSLLALGFLFVIVLGFCRSGGIGAMPGIPQSLRRRPEFSGSGLAVRARLGGLGTQLTYAGVHCITHLAAAIGLLLLLELGVETVIRYEHVGRDGYHSLYRWYRSFEAAHFPDPAGLRGLLQTLTFSLYPNAIKWLMAVFDVPEAIAVPRTALCAAGGALWPLSRLQAVGYYAGVLAYYWLLATPTVAFLFGFYLYLSVNWFHVHYDEAFSSLQVPHFKGFIRCHVSREGDLTLFGLGLERVPQAWREDPRWRTPHGGGSREAPTHRARWPSRWAPVEEAPRGRGLQLAQPPEASVQVVDYLTIPRHRPGSVGTAA